VDARIRVLTGDVARETRDLADWLRQEDDLDALVDVVPGRAEPTYLGGFEEIVLTAVGSSGLAVPAYKSLAAWLKAKASRVSVKVTTDRGSVEIDASNVDDDKIRRLVNDILYGSAGEGDG
jgi:hypothetical protein